MDEALLSRIAAAVSSQRPVTREDLLDNYRSEITVTENMMGYSNPRVTASIDGMSDTEVTHLKYIPLREEGYVVVLPAAAGDDGAVEFTRAASRRTGQTSLRVALSPFRLTIASGRKLRIPVKTITLDIEGMKRQILLLRVKRPASRRTASRKAKPSEQK